MTNDLDIRIVYPKGVFFENKAYMCEMKTTEGDIGILKGHVPTTVILAPGIITITQDGNTIKCMVSGGFAEILKSQITIIAEDILTKEQIDIQRAKDSKDKAQKILNESSDDLEIKKAEVSLKKALARIELYGE